MAGTCRWGIMGTAVIARKNWKAIWNAENASLVAVASREGSRAAEFIRTWLDHVAHHPAPRAVQGYEQLLASDDVDAVYIPLPTGLRKPWVIRAAEAGKHVLCEKPCGAAAADVQEMIDACTANNVQFMDGVMFMHSARLARIRSVLDDPQRVGKVKRITTQFSFCAPEEWLQQDIRLDSSLEPHGCLGDLGWYCIRFGLWVMNWQLPMQVCGRVLADRRREGSPAPVPLEFSAELFFDQQVSHSFYCSFITQHQQWANISGDQGHLTVPDFVLPYCSSELGFTTENSDFILDGCDFIMQRRHNYFGTAEYSHSSANSQEANLFRTFSSLVTSGRRESHWADIALKTQRVLDACYQSARSGGALVAVP